MASLVWGRDPQEAYDNPYEHEAQDQFLREARKLLDQWQVALDQFTMRFHRDDKSLDKATWMLALDLNDTLLECVLLFIDKHHRIAFRLFRDAVETIDLLLFLHSGEPQAANTLKQWYENEVIPHRKSRDFIRMNAGELTADTRRKYHRQPSEYTHRTYRALLKKLYAWRRRYACLRF